MISAADIVVYDELGRVVLLAEVKTPRARTTAHWAADIRTDVAQQLKGFLPDYFLVVTRAVCYLWTSSSPADALPDLELTTGELLGNYLHDVGVPAEKITDSALELVVGIWLRDLTRGAQRATEVLPPTLGLAAATENGRIEFATAA